MSPCEAAGQAIAGLKPKLKRNGQLRVSVRVRVAVRVRVRVRVYSVSV